MQTYSDWVWSIEGVPLPVYREIMQAERAALYPPAEYVAEIERRYSSGPFSEGWPGILASDLESIQHLEVKAIPPPKERNV